MIKYTDKRNATAACPLCGQIKYWDHFLLCEHNNNKREKWEKGLKKTERC